MRAAFGAGLSVLSFLLVAACGSPEPARIRADVARAKLVTHDRPEQERGRFAGMQMPADDLDAEVEIAPTPAAKHRCEVGEWKSCGLEPPEQGEKPSHVMTCILMADGSTAFYKAPCNTPLVVSFDDAPIAFTTPRSDASSFLIGTSDRTEWVSAATPWLALDRDGSGCIDAERELFRFDALADLDENRDGRIDARDAAFAQLVLWSDRDQDRRCTKDELTSLQGAGIVALDVDYVTPAAGVSGSYEGERAATLFRGAGGTGALRRGRIVDVYLSPLD